MIGFKKVPVKGVLITFTASIILVLLLYTDVKTYQSLPVENIESTKILEKTPPETSTYKIHEVKDGENLSIIFEDFEVPLNTAYKIFRLDTQNLLSNIKPGDKMRFNFMGGNLSSIEIMKDQINSLLISISNNISIKKVQKNVELITSFKSGVIESSFYQSAIDSDIPDSVIMDFAYIFGWDVDFVFDIREGDSFHVIYDTPYSEGEKVKNGDIVIAKFINNGNTYYANRFFSNNKKKEYFDADGNNMQKAFLRAPLDFAYISSHFNPNRMPPLVHTL